MWSQSTTNKNKEEENDGHVPHYRQIKQRLRNQLIRQLNTGQRIERETIHHEQPPLPSYVMLTPRPF